MGASPWRVKFFDLREDEDALSELVGEANLTDKQIAKINKEIERLERHGHDLGAVHFDNVEGSKRKVREFKIVADKIEIRFLHKLIDTTFVMLKGYKHKNRRDVMHHLPTAEARLDEWERLHESR
jgi:hypothetical protein